MLRVDLSSQAFGKLTSIPVKHAKQITVRIDRLAHDPRSVPSIAVQNMA